MATIYTESFSNKTENLSYCMAIIIFLTHFGIGWQIETGYLTLPAMSYFFFLSGYHFYLAYSNGRSMIRLLGKRVKTLIIPYILWNIIAFISHMMFTYLRTGMFIKETKWYDIFIVYVNGNACADVPLWYIWRLTSFFIVAKLLYLLIFNRKIGIIVLLLLHGFNLWNLPAYYSFRYFLPVFLLGGYTALHFGEAFQKYWGGGEIQRIISLKACFAISVYILIYLYAIYRYPQFKGIQQYIVVAVSSVVLWIVTAKISLPAKNYLKIPNTTFLYCFHFILYDWVYAATRKIIPYCGERIDGYKILGYLMSISLAMTIILVVDYGMKRCFPQIYNILIGGRVKKES